MSFGKDRSVLASIPSFKQQRAHTKFSGGGGNRGGWYWIGQFTPTDATSGATDRIRIYPASYDVKKAKVGGKDGEIETVKCSYWPFTEHGRKVNGKYRSGICSGGPLAHRKEFRDPCFGCDEHWADKDSMSRHSKYGYSVLHFHKYAKVPQVDDNGKPRVSEKTGNPFYDWQRTSDNQLRGEHKGLEYVDQLMMPWFLGYKENEMLFDKDTELATSCASCGTSESISTLFWSCFNCGEVLIDADSTSLKPEDIAKLVAGEVHCGACDVTGMLVPELECSDCNKPKPSQIFDVDLFVRKPRDPKTNKPGYLSISRVSDPYKLGAEYFKKDGEKPAIFHQINLPQRCTPMEYAKQEETFMMGGVSRDPSKQGRKWGAGSKAPTLGGK